MTKEKQSLDPEMREEVQQLDLDPGGDDVELSMVIDLQRCTGCSSCNFACKNENNLQEGHAWSSRLIETKGKFPNVSWKYQPTLCNQCQDAPCAEGCPTSALYKGEGGITMHDHNQCIGCKYCIVNCPYDELHFHKEDPQPNWDSDEATIEGGTASPKALKEQLGIDDDAAPAPYNPNREVGEHEHPTRYRGIVEKCTFCAHRVTEGELPACVEACPSDSRIFGDLNDPDSKVNEILGQYGGEGLKEEKGTKPKVRYVREFNAGGYEPDKGSVDGQAMGD